jgi:hypothetical protein
MESLYKPTTLHALHEAIERYAALAPTFVESSQVDRIFRQRGSDGFIHHTRDRLVACRGTQPKGPMNLGIEIDRGALGAAHARIVTSKRHDVNRTRKEAFDVAVQRPRRSFTFRRNCLLGRASPVDDEQHRCEK